MQISGWRVGRSLVTNEGMVDGGEVRSVVSVVERENASIGIGEMVRREM